MYNHRQLADRNFRWDPVQLLAKVVRGKVLQRLELQLWNKIPGGSLISVIKRIWQDKKAAMLQSLRLTLPWHFSLASRKSSFASFYL